VGAGQLGDAAPHRTTPAAYEAASTAYDWPSASAVHRPASLRRTPSTSSTTSGQRIPAGTSIGAHRSAGTSTSVSTWALLAEAGPSPSPLPSNDEP
jgi:hypothetical protein